MTATSQATSVLTASHRPTGELVAYSHVPPRGLLEQWRRYRARLDHDQGPRHAPAPKVVELPPHLLN
jgi:hypothetical protein